MKHKTIKALALITISATVWGLSSCGSNSSKPEDSNSTTTATTQPADDGQGVGKFKNITLASLNENVAKQGKLIFEAKCSACHNTTDVKKVGPGLKGITERRKPAWILNQITNPLEMTKKDPTSKELLAKYLTQMTFQDVSDDQAAQILEFFRSNDSGGGAEAHEKEEKEHEKHN